MFINKLSLKKSSWKKLLKEKSLSLPLTSNLSEGSTKKVKRNLMRPQDNL